jgi:uncharacterized membrane protein YidH (DUF202 family)
MIHKDDLESGLSAIEIAFFAEGQGDTTEDAHATPSTRRRAHLSRYLKWVVVIVAAGVVLLVAALHERSQNTEAMRPTAQVHGEDS